MFSWKIKRDNLDPIFRVIYGLQLVAVVAIVSGFFLVWWDAEKVQTAWQLFNRSTRELRDRNPKMFVQPLLLLWLMWPSVVLSAARSVTGLAVQPVSFRRMALMMWVGSLLPLAHYYVNYGESISDLSPLKEGVIGIGFWLSGSATVILGGLLVTESLIRPPVEVFVGPEAPQGVQDAESLWEGNYRTCPSCGMLNDPAAKSCYNCKNLLFNFKPD